MSVYDDLAAGVATTTDVEASAIKLLDNLSALLKAAVADAANVVPKVQAVIDSLKTNTDALAADITANTPAA